MLRRASPSSVDDGDDTALARENNIMVTTHTTTPAVEMKDAIFNSVLASVQTLQTYTYIYIYIYRYIDRDVHIVQTRSQKF